MGRFYLSIAAVAIAAAAAFTTHASAATLCPKSESFFGVIQRVNGNMLTVSTEQNHWADVRIQPGARVNANGLSLRPGTFVGAYGCVEPGGVFDANEVTLAASRTTYHESLSGTVERVASDRLTVRESGNRYVSWYVPDADRFSVGQQISGVGMVGAGGVFYPQVINGQSVAFEPESTGAPVSAKSTITLSGVVRAVRPGSLVVWEPSHGTTGMWIVRDSDRFHVGQRVVARGTEDRSGKFYPIDISIH
jgi:hypothetical protein